MEFPLHGSRDGPGDFLEGGIDAMVLLQLGLGRLVGVMDEPDGRRLGLLPLSCRSPTCVGGAFGHSCYDPLLKRR